MDNFITKEDELLAKDLKSNPEVLASVKLFCEKAGLGVAKDDDETFEFIATGLILKFRLSERRKIHDNNLKKYEQG